jgi:hypothetical protein
LRATSSDTSVGPAFRQIESDYRDGIIVLAGHQVVDDSLQVGTFDIGFAVGATLPPGHMPQQPVKKDDQLQPLREKSGF